MNLGKLGQALTAREIFDLIQDDLEQVEKRSPWNRSPRSTPSPPSASICNRPAASGCGPLCCCSPPSWSATAGRRAIQLGAVVEMIHAATLVHDDVIDAAETRRGRPSTNVQWGNHTCVLAGDWLYMQAFQIALRERNFHMLDLLIGLTQMMVEGELLQLERIGRIDVTEADCMELVDRKTACLFSRLRPPGRVMARRRRRRPRKRSASTPGISAWRSNWWTTSWISRRARRLSASRWAAICAKAK